MVPTARSEDKSDDGALTVGFIDLAGFTALTEAHGDQEAVALLGRFEELARASISGKDRLVKTIGDAVMLAFAGPASALETTARLLVACFAEPRFPIPRAGLHHGPVVERGGDLFGATVNLAARVAGQAHGGQVLGTAPLAEVARRRGTRVVDLGAFDLRNVAEPIELFEIELCPAAAGDAVEPVCRMQVARAHAAGRLRHRDTDYWFCSLECAAAFSANPDRYARG